MSLVEFSDGFVLDLAAIEAIDISTRSKGLLAYTVYLRSGNKIDVTELGGHVGGVPVPGMPRDELIEKWKAFKAGATNQKMSWAEIAETWNIMRRS